MVSRAAQVSKYNVKVTCLDQFTVKIKYNKMSVTLNMFKIPDEPPVGGQDGVDVGQSTWDHKVSFDSLPCPHVVVSLSKTPNP